MTCSLMCSAAFALVLLLVPPADVSWHTPACNTSHVSSPNQTLDENLHMGSARPSISLNETQFTVRKSLNITPANISPDTRPASTKTLPDTGSIPAKNLNYLDTEATTKTSIFSKSDARWSRENASVVSDNSLRKPKINGPVANFVAVPERNRRSELESGGEPREKMPDGKEEEGTFDFLSSLKMMDAQHQLFFLILIVVSLWEFASAPLEWVADDGLCEYLDYADASEHYRSSETWGLLGAACGVGGTGLLVSQLNCYIAGHTIRSTVHFFCYAGLAALALPAAVYLPIFLNKKRDRANGLLKAIQLVRGSPRALLSAITTLLFGVAASAVDDFLLWQMQDHGSSEIHMGLSLALALLSQASFPLMASQLSRLLGPSRLLAVGAASLGVQCFYYAFLWGPWAVLPAQLLSCFSSGALWWAVKAQCEDVATPGAQRSVRRVYSALSLHLGRGMGSFAGGLVIQRFGLAVLFIGMALGLILWCICLPLLQWKAPHQRRINYSRLLAADTSEASDSDSDPEKDWLDKAMDDDRSNDNYRQRINH